jgi:hypothetical protein
VALLPLLGALLLLLLLLVVVVPLSDPVSQHHGKLPQQLHQLVAA